MKVVVMKSWKPGAWSLEEDWGLAKDVEGTSTPPTPKPDGGVDKLVPEINEAGDDLLSSRGIEVDMYERPRYSHHWIGRT